MLNLSGSLRCSALSATFVAAASIGCKHEPIVTNTPKGPQYTLRLTTKGDFKRVYNLRRLDKMRPKWLKNSDWDETFKLLVTSHLVPQSKNLEVDVNIADVGGKNTSFVVKDMAPLIKKEKLGRTVSELGVQSPWAWMTSNNAGYSGFDAARGIGMYEVGFLELHYPNDPVHVGDTWTGIVRVGNESYEGDHVVDVKGNDAKCTYRLVAVDAQKHTAKITFSFDAEITATSLPPPGSDWPSSKMVMHDSGTGAWVIDLKTGLPISFNSDRTTETDERGKKVTERYQSIVLEEN